MRDRHRRIFGIVLEGISQRIPPREIDEEVAEKEPGDGMAHFVAVEVKLIREEEAISNDRGDEKEKRKGRLLQALPERSAPGRGNTWRRRSHVGLAGTTITLKRVPRE